MLRYILLASAASAIIAAPAAAQSFDSAAVSGLGVRNIGSATMSGRIAAVAGRQEKDGKVTLLIGSASGGVWKSEDGGTTFHPVFDKQPVKSIGAVALDPTNKDVMWVGSGESWTRNSVSLGNGVYKSTDGGETWTNVGLPNSERIDRIIVHPKNGNIVYVCAPGRFVVRLARPRPVQDHRRRQDLVADPQGTQPVDRLLVRRDGPGEPGTSACRHLGLPPQAVRISLRRRRPRQAVGQPLRREP